MPAIEVTHLQKTFQTKRKAAGLSGSLRALVKPEYSTVEAVRGLSFQMEAGELLGFIGPNGAGKSTTIKMLTGILHPNGGAAQVLGFTPWKDRQKLAYHIGTVFGQRPQLQDLCTAFHGDQMWQQYDGRVLAVIIQRKPGNTKTAGCGQFL